MGENSLQGDKIILFNQADYSTSLRDSSQDGHCHPDANEHILSPDMIKQSLQRRQLAFSEVSEPSFQGRPGILSAQRPPTE